MTSELELRLEDFDGVAVSVLSEARAACRDAPDFISDLIRLCLDPRPNISVGATWILKAEADDGTDFPSAEIQPIIEGVDRIEHWQAKLHLCQSVERFDVTEDQAARLFRWAETLKNHSRPFVRAWSLHARVVLGARYDRLKKASLSALYAAENDEAASVRARARNLAKHFA